MSLYVYGALQSIIVLESTFIIIKTKSVIHSLSFGSVRLLYNAGAMDDMTKTSGQYQDANSHTPAAFTGESPTFKDGSKKSGFGYPEANVAFPPQQRRKKVA